MKRLALVAALVAVLAATPAALADDPVQPAPPTAPAPVTPAPSPAPAAASDVSPAATNGPPAPPPPPITLPGQQPEPVTVVPPGTVVAGLDVGGLAFDDAETVVASALAEPLVLKLGTETLRVSPASFGAVAYVGGALRRAQSVGGARNVEVVVRVDGSRVRRYLAKLASRFDVAPVDSRFELRDGIPTATPAVPGRSLDRIAAAATIVKALGSADRKPVVLPVLRAPAKVTPASFTEPLIVIRRKSNDLGLYRGVKLVRRFRVATGQPAYPTPLGHFAIKVMWKDPWWYPPPSPWAAGEKPTPPGPGNPLGTRWMGLTAPGVGIHGTPKDSSIGYSLSHGCIRMHVPQAEWLFDHVTVGTQVWIVQA